MFVSVQLRTDRDFEAVALGVFAETAAESGSSPFLAMQEVKAALARREFTGAANSIVETFVRTGAMDIRVILFGLGKRASADACVIRKSAAALGRRLAQAKEEKVLIGLADDLEGTSVTTEEAGHAIGESLGLLAWNGRLYEGTATTAEPQPALQIMAEDTALAVGLADGLAVARSTNLARDLSQTPPNIATPIWLAQQARELASEVGLEFRVIQGHELEEQRLSGLATVGKGSIHPPCLIRLEYKPAGQQPHAKPLVLIGKTITYDTGGLTLKINNGMVGMKRDKDGGCAVLGAMHAIATRIRPQFPVVGLLVAAENSVSANAFRPDDVITYRNGVTVEVTNTDAEGRLVLADALCWASEVEQATAIVDLATLTGGVVVALGSVFAGLFCEDEDLRTRLEASGVRTGERLWRLPLDPEYKALMKSPVADILNSNPNRKAHPVQGAIFLSYFVPESIPWAHIDIAGVHAVDSDSGPFIKGPTGFGVRLLVELVRAMG